MEKLVIIDGNSLVNRAFYAMPPLFNAEGINCNAVFGVANILARLFVDNKPEYMCVAFDAGRHTFRNDMYAEYKATRKGMPEDLAIQMPILKEMLKTMKITILEQPGIEADDIIGTMTKKFDNVQNIVVTGDRDSLQLINSNTEVWLTKKGLSEIAVMNEKTFNQEWGLVPSQIIDLKALMGDSSDNIPGVAGIGEKTAMTLLKAYGNIDNLYNNLDKITGKLREKLESGRDICYLSYDLATIRCQENIPVLLEDLKTVFPWDKEAYEFCNKYEFRSLTRRSELFCTTNSAPKIESKNTIITLSQLDELLKKYEKCDTVAVSITDEKIEFAWDREDNYTIELFVVSQEMVIEKAKSIFADFDKTVLLYSLKKLYRLADKIGIKLQANLLDVPLATYLINSNIKEDDPNHMLDYFGLSKEHLAVGLYTCWTLCEEGIQKLGLNSLYFDLELPLVRVLYDMERNGIRINTGVLDSLGPKYRAEIEGIRQKICDLAGVEFNPNSPKQLAVVLFDNLKLDDTRNKKHSTNVDVLESLRGKHPIIEELIRFRTITKLYSTYIEGMRNYIKEDGKIHTQFNQTSTVTGRLSSNEPNLQNIPVRTEEGKELRKMFVASEGCKLISADYSQIELRLLAHYSKDSVLVNAYLHDNDIHTITASQIFGVPIESVTPSMRRSAKAVNFGIIYGISPYGLAQNLGISAGKAKDYIDKYFLTYPTIKKFLDSSVEEYKKTGKVTTLLGRIRNFDISGSTKNSRFTDRAAMNMPLQGSASDIIKLAMLAVFQELNRCNLKAKIVLQIHDELILDTPENEVEKVKAILKDKMENVIKLNVPLIVDIEVGDSWYDV